MNLKVCQLKGTVSNPVSTPAQREAAISELVSLSSTGNHEATDLLNDLRISSAGLQPADKDKLSNSNATICLPCYGGEIKLRSALSILRLTHSFRDCGVRFSIMDTPDCSLIPEARNKLANKFYNDTPGTHLLFLDADIEFEPNAVLKMLAADVDLVGLAYARKTIHWDRVHSAVKAGATIEQLAAAATIMSHIDALPLKPTDWNKPVEVERVDCGGMLIKREVFRRIIESNPHLKYATGHCFFDSGLGNGSNTLGEGFRFCELARKSGSKTYIWPWSRTVHHGSQAFEYDLKSTMMMADSGGHP